MLNSERQNNVFVFDLEGTLTISKWRNHWAELKQWEKFECLMLHDPENKMICDIARSAYDAGMVVILTGKMERGITDARKWLNRYGIRHDWIHMRPNNDFRPSKIYKAEYLETYEKSRITMVFDDRKDIIDHLKSLGYPTYLV